MKQNQTPINKKILVLGGSHRDIPLIKAAEKLGYFVITLGNRDYYLGHHYSNKAYKIDFNDLEKVREIIKKEKIDFLLPGCGEESYLNTVKLAHEFNMGNFDDLETARLIHNKWKFKEFCLKHSISTPKGILYKNSEDLIDLDFPIIVKPTNLSGGRGVELVNSFKELSLSLKNAKKLSNEIFLEEFIDGKLIAYSIFIENQKIVYEFFAQDRTYLNKYLISTAYPSKVSNKVSQRLKNDIEKLAKKLDLVNGMFHLQVLIKDDTPYIIDVTRRIPGDFFPYLMEYCDDVKYSKAVVKSYTIGKIANEFIKTKKGKFIIRHCSMPKKNGIYKDLFIDELLRDKIIYKFDLIDKNSLVENYLNTQVCIVFIELEKEDKEILDNINDLIYPIIEKE